MVKTPGGGHDGQTLETEELTERKKIETFFVEFEKGNLSVEELRIFLQPFKPKLVSLIIREMIGRAVSHGKIDLGMELNSCEKNNAEFNRNIVLMALILAEQGHYDLASTILDRVEVDELREKARQRITEKRSVQQSKRS